MLPGAGGEGGKVAEFGSCALGFGHVYGNSAWLAWPLGLPMSELMIRRVYHGLMLLALLFGILSILG